MMRQQARVVSVMTVLTIAVLAVATFRSQVVRAAAHPPMAEEVFRNVQVLKGIPVDEFLGAMGIIASSVGRGCSECHVLDSSSDWALYAVDTPLKVATRTMLRMTKQMLNHSAAVSMDQAHKSAKDRWNSKELPDDLPALAVLTDHTSALVGHSGVGKSTRSMVSFNCVCSTWPPAVVMGPRS